jgi:hypothetical protein
LEIRDPCARREKVLGRVARRNSRRTGRVERPAERLQRKDWLSKKRQIYGILHLFLDSGSDIKFPFPEDYVIGIFQGALGVVFTLERDKAVALRYSGSVLDYLGGLYCTVATEKLEEFAFGGVGRNATDEDPVWNKGTCKGSLLFEESRRDARGLTVFGGVVVGGRWGALGDRLRISIRHRSAGWSVDGWTVGALFAVGLRGGRHFTNYQANSLRKTTWGPQKFEGYIFAWSTLESLHFRLSTAVSLFVLDDLNSNLGIIKNKQNNDVFIANLTINTNKNFSVDLVGKRKKSLGNDLHWKFLPSSRGKSARKPENSTENNTNTMASQAGHGREEKPWKITPSSK